ncbi:hypothetical protein RZS08_54325, partial [Arthrospira platensis SPKY1]|nr:hypothetical protein [Arthrospira platensis SPKY1]
LDEHADVLAGAVAAMGGRLGHTGQDIEALHHFPEDGVLHIQEGQAAALEVELALLGGVFDPFLGFPLIQLGFGDRRALDDVELGAVALAFGVAGVVLAGRPH